MLQHGDAELELDNLLLRRLRAWGVEGFRAKFSTPPMGSVTNILTSPMGCVKTAPRFRALGLIFTLY